MYTVVVAAVIDPKTSLLPKYQTVKSAPNKSSAEFYAVAVMTQVQQVMHDRSENGETGDECFPYIMRPICKLFIRE
jgi:hypothetical protein